MQELEHTPAAFIPFWWVSRAGLLFYEATNLRRSITVIVKPLSNSVTAIPIPKTSNGISIKLENIVGFVASAGQ